jgi:hypothetical protein
MKINVLYGFAAIPDEKLIRLSMVVTRRYIRRLFRYISLQRGGDPAGEQDGQAFFEGVAARAGGAGDGNVAILRLQALILQDFLP